MIPSIQNKNPSQNYFQEGFMCFGREVVEVRENKVKGKNVWVEMVNLNI